MGLTVCVERNEMGGVQTVQLMPLTLVGRWNKPQVNRFILGPDGTGGTNRLYWYLRPVRPIMLGAS